MCSKHAVAQLKNYFSHGGTILFGTDVGYTQLYDTTSEYEYMGRAGMNFRDILASLTTNPATFFKAGRTGKVVKGYAADLVVLDADPGARRPQLRQGGLHDPGREDHLQEVAEYSLGCAASCRSECSPVIPSDEGRPRSG